MKFFERTFSENALDVLAEIIMIKSPLSKNGINLPEWRQYNVIFRQKASEKKFLDLLEVSDKEVFENSSTFVKACIILPHVQNFQNDLIVIQNILLRSLSNIVDSMNTHGKHPGMIITSILVETLIHLEVDPSHILQVLDKILPMCKSNEDTTSLNVIDMCLSYIEMNKSGRLMN
jgi:hypothetical protein